MRIYGDVQKLVDEVMDARTLIGVHFRFANADGAAMGDRCRAVAVDVRGQRSHHA